MNDLIDELILEFNMMTLEIDKKEIKTIINHIYNTDKSKNITEDVDSLIDEFSQLDISKNTQIAKYFYIFILECLNRDNEIRNSMIFVPPEYQQCN